MDRKKPKSQQLTGYGDDTVHLILEELREGTAPAPQVDLVVLVAGDLVHPDLGFNYITDLMPEKARNRSLNSRHRLTERIISTFCSAVESGMQVSELSRMAAGVSDFPILFVAQPDAAAIESQLHELGKLGFGANEWNLYRFVKRPSGGYVAIYVEVYSYWLK